MPQPIAYAAASPAVRAVFDDIKATRKVDDVNNFWKYLANDPATLRRTWESVKEIMAPGALDVLHQGDDLSRGQRHQRLRLLHRQPRRGGAQGRHVEAMFGELMAVVGMANETNRLANGYRVPIDKAFEEPSR